MSFTDQKQRLMTAEEFIMWEGIPKKIKCQFCGHIIKKGDKWRWIYALPHGICNFTVCEKCDGDSKELIQKRIAMVNEYKRLKNLIK
jgi:hypothetical protein